jgi:DNA-binding XRE family transcriptional regulator
MNIHFQVWVEHRGGPDSALAKAVKDFGPQTDLARMAGVSQTTISDWLRGQKRIELEVAQKIAVLLGASIEGDYQWRWK